MPPQPLPQQFSFPNYLHGQVPPPPPPFNPYLSPFHDLPFVPELPPGLRHRSTPSSSSSPPSSYSYSEDEDEEEGTKDENYSAEPTDGELKRLVDFWKSCPKLSAKTPEELATWKRDVLRQLKSVGRRFVLTFDHADKQAVSLYAKYLVSNIVNKQELSI